MSQPKSYTFNRFEESIKVKEEKKEWMKKHDKN